MAYIELCGLSFVLAVYVHVRKIMMYQIGLHFKALQQEGITANGRLEWETLQGAIATVIQQLQWRIQDFH